MQTFGKQTNNPGVFTPFTRRPLPFEETTIEGEVVRAPLQPTDDIREDKRDKRDQD